MTRVAVLAAGQCRCLLESATAAAADEPRPDLRRHASANNDGQRRTERAAALAHLGEFSAASAALTASPMAPVPLPENLRHNLPAPLALCRKRFLQNVCDSRRHAAAGPSFCAAEKLATAAVPPPEIAGVGLGRMVAAEARQPCGIDSCLPSSFNRGAWGPLSRAVGGGIVAYYTTRTFTANDAPEPAPPLHEFATPVPTLRSIPRFLTIGARLALVYALQAIKDAGTAQRRLQAWKLFLLTPRLVFARCADTGAVGKVRLGELSRILGGLG
ncbi:unnamed protein product [Effrenium voratum]|nr:unnamed protein product [Effrenium voratum]